MGHGTSTVHYYLNDRHLADRGLRGWNVAFDTAGPTLPIEVEVVKRNRIVEMAARSFVLLSHER